MFSERFSKFSIRSKIVSRNFPFLPFLSNCNLFLLFLSVINTEFIPAGHQEIPFEFVVPDNLSLPSSFQSRYGQINYGIEALFGDQERRREILLDCPITKNLYLTVGGTSEKDFGVLSFASGSISMQATLDRKGFCRGEPMKVNLTIDNNSTATVKPRVSFYQTQIYMTG